MDKGGLVVLLEGDRNGDGRADFQVEVHMVSTITLDDLILV